MCALPIFELIAGTRVIDRHRPVEVSERQRSRHLAPRCDVDALCGAAEVLDMRDLSRTDEERTLGLGGEAWLILVDQHRVELRHRSRVSGLEAEGGIETVRSEEGRGGKEWGRQCRS